MLNNLKKIFINLILAAVMAFIIVNAACFFYKHLPKAYNREANVTSMVWNPNSYILQSSEGIGFYQIDENGFLNNELPNSYDSYVLVLGASHTEGKEVLSGQRYTDILNIKLLETKRNCLVYNTGMDGHFYPMLVAGFTSAVQEFSDAQAIVLEVGELDFSLEELEEALVQRPYKEHQSAKALAKDAGVKNRITTLIKENIPFINVIKTSFADFKVDISNAFGIREIFVQGEEVKKVKIDNEQYYKAFRKTTDLLRDNYNQKIIILYHPSVEIMKNGEMICKYPENYEAFKKACEDSGLIFCDVGTEYLKAYKEKNIVPRGFHNTTIGSGHINKYGHRIIAEKLYPYILEATE